MTQQEKIVKEQAIQQLMDSEEYMLISIAPKNKDGYQDTHIHISSSTFIGQAMQNLARSNPAFRDMLVDAVFTL